MQNSNQLQIHDVARRLALLLLFLGAGLALMQPCAGAPFQFQATGSLVTARDNQTATLLSNGKVLVVGGMGSDSHRLASAELYDPTTGTWTSTGSLSGAHSDVAARWQGARRRR